MTESSQLSHAPPPVELRYFAASRDDWELLLLRARQLGASTIAAQVPWAWHAPAPGALDFDGATDDRRDLVGFVRLCGQMGLHVLLDPGPLHGDLLGGGVPAWLLQQHPNLRARGPDGAPWLDIGGLPYPSALHPEFLTAARGWIGAFSAALRVLQAPSGPIATLYAGTAGTPAQMSYNYAAGTLAGAPSPPSVAHGELGVWDHDSSPTATLDWLRADGWSVPLRQGSLFQQRPGSPAAPGAAPDSPVLIELPAGRGHALLAAAPAPASC